MDGHLQGESSQASTGESQALLNSPCIVSVPLNHEKESIRSISKILKVKPPREVSDRVELIPENNAGSGTLVLQPGFTCCDLGHQAYSI